MQGDIGSTFRPMRRDTPARWRVGSKQIFRLPHGFLTVNFIWERMELSLLWMWKEGTRVYLLKTSNPSSGEFQDRLIDGRPLYELGQKKVVEWGADWLTATKLNVGAVVGVNHPRWAKSAEAFYAAHLLLVRDGAKVGSTERDLKYCFNDDGFGAVVNSSRGLLLPIRRKLMQNSVPNILEKLHGRRCWIWLQISDGAVKYAQNGSKRWHRKTEKAWRKEREKLSRKK